MDTHALLFDALFPKRLSKKAKNAIQQATALACADISLWEIAMLLSKGRVVIGTTTSSFLKDLVAAKNMRILPITPIIADASQKWHRTHQDPADLIIAATAFCYQIPLVTKDRELHKIVDIQCIW